MFTGVNLLIVFILGIIGAMIHIRILALLYTLTVLVPLFAISIRRLHDTNRSGWWLLLGLVPVIGNLVLLMFTLQGSQNEGNRYGDVSELESPSKHFLIL